MKKELKTKTIKEAGQKMQSRISCPAFFVLNKEDEMELIIAKSLGGLKAVVQDDFKKVDIQDVGRGYISYASRKEEKQEVIINNIEVYDDETKKRISELARKKGIEVDEKSPVEFILTDEQKRMIKEEILKRYNEKKEQALQKIVELLKDDTVIKVHEYNIPSDAGLQYYFSIKDVKLSEFEEKILQIAMKDITQALRWKEAIYATILEKEYLEKEDIPSSGLNTVYYFYYKDLKEFAVEVNKEIEEKEREYNEKRQKKFDEAKETGKPVELYSYCEDCNDENEDCDIDTITVYAMPDGTVKEERSHNW